MAKDKHIGFRTSNEIKQILDQWRSSPEHVRGDDTAAQLVRVIREIAQVRKRLDAIKTEIEELAQAELYLSIFPKAWTDSKWAGGGLGLNRHDVMEVRVMGRRLALEAWRVLPGKPIDPFRTNG